MARHDLGPLSDIPEGLSKGDAGGTAVLLVREGDEVRALAHACPHFGLPLSKGHLEDGIVICAFHHACFDAKSGRQMEPPGHGDLRRYDLEVVDGRVMVEVPEGAEPHPAPDYVRRDGDARTFVLVGSGAASDEAALGLRERGFGGRIEMIDRAGEPPYDRTLLSKAVLADGDAPRDVTITAREALAARDIELVEGTVTRIDAGSVTLSSGETREFDGLFVAPGGTPRRLKVPGEELDGVHALRSRTDGAVLARAAGAAKRAVIVGAGFIGMEGALSLAKRGLDVTVVMPDEVPLAKVLGEAVGKAVMAEHEKAGVRFVTGRTAKAFEGQGRVSAVVLDDGSTHPADLVVTAVGVTPATAEIEGLETRDDGGVAVGRDLSVPGMPRVFVGGDCAQVPTPWGAVRIEHWRVARQHGALAARNLLGEGADLAGVPFFWTALARQYRYLGHAEGWDEISIDGDASGPFVARYVKDGKVMALAGAGRDAEIAAAHSAMIREGGPLQA